MSGGAAATETSTVHANSLGAFGAANSGVQAPQPVYEAPQPAQSPQWNQLVGELQRARQDAHEQRILNRLYGVQIELFL